MGPAACVLPQLPMTLHQNSFSLYSTQIFVDLQWLRSKVLYVWNLFVSLLFVVVVFDTAMRGEVLNLAMVEPWY